MITHTNRTWYETQNTRIIKIQVFDNSDGRDIQIPTCEKRHFIGFSFDNTQYGERERVVFMGCYSREYFTTRQVMYRYSMGWWRVKYTTYSVHTYLPMPSISSMAQASRPSLNNKTIFYPLYVEANAYPNRRVMKFALWPSSKQELRVANNIILLHWYEI